MALLFRDSYDDYNSLSQKWTVSGSIAYAASEGRFLGGAMKVTSNNQYVRIAVTAGDVFICNFAIKSTTLPTNSGRPFDLIQFHDGANCQCALRLYDTGVIKLERLSGSGFLNGSGTVLATSSGSALTTGNWYAIEIKITIANSGSCTVKQDGATIISFSGDTQATGSANCDTILFGFAEDTGGGTILWDDIIIMDDSGSFMKDFIGDKRIYTLFPVSDGFYSQWTPSTGTNHAPMVDETPPDDDTTYNFATTPGDKDTYNMGDIPGGATGIEAIVVGHRARKDDAGTRTLKAKVRSNSTDADGSNFNLGSGYAFFAAPFYQNPDGSVAWTATTVNAVQVGQEVVT